MEKQVTLERIFKFILKYVYALLSCLYLFSFGILFAPNRSRILTILDIGGEGRGGGSQKTQLPIIKISELILKNDPLWVFSPIGELGNVSLLEIVVIGKLIKFYNPNNVFEIGTFNGRTTLNIASNCSENAKVYTLDLPKTKANFTKLPLASGDIVHIDKDMSGTRFIGTDYEKKIIQLLGDSADFNFSPYLNMIDFIFVDGSHSYEYVLNDSIQSLKLLRNGKGIVLWHDYQVFEGVTRALNELYLKNCYFKNLQHISGTSLVCLKII